MAGQNPWATFFNGVEPTNKPTAAALATEPASCGTAEELGRRHLAEVRGKIEHLRHMEAALTELTANCAEGRTDCPMLRSIAEADA